MRSSRIFERYSGYIKKKKLYKETHFFKKINHKDNSGARPRRGMRLLCTGMVGKIKTLPRPHQIKDLGVKGKIIFSRGSKIKVIVWRLDVQSTPGTYSSKIQSLGSYYLRGKELQPGKMKPFTRWMVVMTAKQLYHT